MYIYFIGAVVAYLIGTISPSLIIATIKKKDIRAHGTGNLGASNTTILLGWKWGVLVGVIDILKSFIPITVVKLLLGEYTLLPYIVAACAILGHIFPFYMKFKGGKGLATYFGAMLGLNWAAFIVIGAVFLVVTYATDYIVVGTYTVITMFPVYLYFFVGNIPALAMFILIMIIIGYKHRMNIVRIVKGEEVGLFEAFSNKRHL